MIRIHIAPIILMMLIVIPIMGFQSCGTPENERKKVAYVNSYHRGHPPSDEITAGVYESLPADSFEIVSYFMDTKRNSSKGYIVNKAVEILDSIKMDKPDLLIVSDDNAVKYLVEPHSKDLDIPVVFCGVNWSAQKYDLSQHNITGILEILPVAELLTTMKSYYPSMQKLMVLNENTTTSRKTKPLLETLCRRAGISVTQELVNDFKSWKEVFMEANLSHDIIFLPTMGAIKNWDHEEAIRIIDQHIKVPLVTCEDFMMPYCVFGLTQTSKEQGTWAAETAIKILQGSSPADIPFSRNHITTVWINSSLSEKINFQLDEDLMSKARIID